MGSSSSPSYRDLENALRSGDLVSVRAVFAAEPRLPNVEDPLTGTAFLALAITWSPLPLVRQLLLAPRANTEARTRIDEYATEIEEPGLLGNTEGASMLRRALASKPG